VNTFDEDLEPAAAVGAARLGQHGHRVVAEYLPVADVPEHQLGLQPVARRVDALEERDLRDLAARPRRRPRPLPLEEVETEPALLLRSGARGLQLLALIKHSGAQLELGGLQAWWVVRWGGGGGE